METSQYLSEVLKELQWVPQLISDVESEQLIQSIESANKVFVAGAGRSGFMIRSLAMRLMHMSVQAYVVGETVTPGLSEGDLLIIGSGSGETKSLTSMAEKAKKLGASLALLTTSPGSTIGKLADIIVKLPGAPKDPSNKDYQTIQPMGSLFEQTLLLYGDALVLRTMELRRLTSESMFGQHANLE
ncbi:MAG: 6-phospho-3-hexuloisomerase [Bacillota bacterium]|uniref:6-phospho-3-hexuloisomerase n=1 Tax=Paenibacillus maysiensis TaxID=1155954 RepID=UPI00047235D0|nr:6-phospho-3-hexuloisomerase [Paenibacillus maysiensis]